MSDSQRGQQWHGDASSQGGPVFQGNQHAGRDIHYHLPPHGHHPADKEIRDWISPLNFWARYQDILSQRHVGTGTWFLEDERFRKWLDGSISGLLCPGKAGSGKTVLSAVVVSQCLPRRKNAKVGVTCVFFDYNDRQNQTAFNLLSSLVQQLLQGTDTLDEGIRAIYADHKKHGTRPGLDEWVKILQSVTRHFSEVFVVVDAFDECARDVAGKFVRPLLQLENARILVTSRPDSPNLGRHFENFTTFDVSASAHDVGSYLSSCIEDSDLEKLVEVYPDYHQKIVSTISRKSDGMFLLARLHISSLLGLDNPKAVDLALVALPTEIFATYDGTMKRIEDQPEHKRTRAKQVLMWISCAMRPLTVEELRHALGVELHTRQLDRKALPVESLLTPVCGGLVTIDKESQVIRLIHETTQAYLEERRSNLFPNAQEDIARVCLTYLSFDTFGTGSCSNYKLFEARLQENAFLEYAAQYWAIHSQGEVQLRVMDLALRFLKDEQKISCAAQITKDPSISFFHSRPPKNVSGLHICSSFGLKHILDKLLRTSNNINPKDSLGQTPLFLAAKNGHEAVIKLLFDNGVAVDSRSRLRETPLFISAKNGHEAVVKLLLDSDAAVNSRNYLRETPLLVTTRNGHEAVVKLLLDNGAAVNQKDIDGFTPLSHASFNEHEAVVQLLLDHGAHETCNPF